MTPAQRMIELGEALIVIDGSDLIEGFRLQSGKLAENVVNSSDDGRCQELREVIGFLTALSFIAGEEEGSFFLHRPAERGAELIVSQRVRAGLGQNRHG